MSSPQGVVEERAGFGVVLVVLGQALVDVGQAARMRSWCRFNVGRSMASAKCAGQQLVALGFQARPVRGQIRDLLIAVGAAFVEGRVDAGGEVAVGASLIVMFR